MGKGKFSLFLGALLGATFGLLFAPTKGKEFREKLKKEREKGGSGFDTVKSHAEKMHSDIAGSIQQITKCKKFKQITNKAKEQLEEVSGIKGEDLTHLKDAAKEKIKSAKSEINHRKEQLEKVGKKVIDALKKAK